MYKEMRIARGRLSGLLISTCLIICVIHGCVGDDPVDNTVENLREREEEARKNGHCYRDTQNGEMVCDEDAQEKVSVEQTVLYFGKNNFKL